MFRSIFRHKVRGQGDPEFLVLLIVIVLIFALVVGCISIATSKPYRFQFNLAGEAVNDALAEAQQFGLKFGEERFLPKRYTVYTMSEGEDRNVIEGVIIGRVELDGVFTEMEVNVPLERYLEAKEEGLNSLYDTYNCDSDGKEYSDNELNVKYVIVICKAGGWVALKSDMASFIKFTYYTDQSALLEYEERAPNDITLVVVEQLLKPALGEPRHYRDGNIERRFPGLQITAAPAAP